MIAIGQLQAESFIPWILGVVGTLLVLGVGAIARVLWAIKADQGEIKTSVAVIANQNNDHGRRIGDVEEWKKEAQPQLHTLYHYHRNRRQTGDA